MRIGKDAILSSLMRTLYNEISDSTNTRQTFSFHSNILTHGFDSNRRRNSNILYIKDKKILIVETMSYDINQTARKISSYLRIFYSGSFLGQFKVDSSLINIYGVEHL